MSSDSDSDRTIPPEETYSQIIDREEEVIYIEDTTEVPETPYSQLQDEDSSLHFTELEQHQPTSSMTTTGAKLGYSSLQFTEEEPQPSTSRARWLPQGTMDSIPPAAFQKFSKQGLQSKPIPKEPEERPSLKRQVDQGWRTNGFQLFLLDNQLCN